MKSWRQLEHTADLLLEGYGPTRKAAVEALAAGLIASLAENPANPLESRVVASAGDDLEETIVALLSEINYLAQAQNWLSASCKVVHLSNKSATAELIGEPTDPPRHRPAEIKGVTYHYYNLERSPKGWTLRVLFDL